MDEVANLSAQFRCWCAGSFRGLEAPKEESAGGESRHHLLQEVADRLDGLSEVHPEDALFLVYTLLCGKNFLPEK